MLDLEAECEQINRANWHKLFNTKIEYDEFSSIPISRGMLKQRIIDFYLSQCIQNDQHRLKDDVDKQMEKEFTTDICKYIWENLINQNYGVSITEEARNKNTFSRGITNHLSMDQYEYSHFDRLYAAIDTDDDEKIDENDFIQFFMNKSNDELDEFMTTMKRQFIQECLMWYSIRCNVKSNEISDDAWIIKLNSIKDNMRNHFQDNRYNNFKKFQSQVKDMKSVNDDNNKCILNVFGETGIFLWIFDYLEFWELKHYVYKTCKLFHVQALPIMDRKYFEWISSEIFKNDVDHILKQVHPDMNARVDVEYIVNGLLMSVLNKLIDKLANDDDVNVENTEHSLLDATVNIVLPGELSKHAINEGRKAMERFDKVTNKYKQENFTIKEIKQSMIEMKETF